MFRQIGIALLLSVAVLFSAYPASAQDGGDGTEVCSPDYIHDAVRAIYAAYDVRAASATDSAAALQEVAALRDELDKLYAQCRDSAGVAVVAPPETPPETPPTASATSGTRENPHAFNVPGESGAGFTLRVTGYLRPADRVIDQASIVNPPPGAGEEYIILDVVLICTGGIDGRCEINADEFELVGDRGLIYEFSTLIYYEDTLDINVLDGTSDSGQLVFLVRADDTNLRLAYLGSWLNPQYTVYAAEPAPGDGILVQPTVNRLNIRSGPGTQSSIAGTLETTDTVLAFGRNSDGSWLNIPQGWVSAAFVTPSGDIFALPVTGQ